MKKQIFLIGILFLATIHLHAQERTIELDLDKTSGLMNTMYKECIGAGRANEGLRADWQQQLSLVKKECDFKYIRFHGLLEDDMAVYKEDKDGNPQYNYQYIDVLFDYILSIDMKPFVELGFMPNDLASGEKTVFWWKGNITPPKDYDKWEDLIYNLVKHWAERYGEDELKDWYFEVWNEPNLKDLFWAGDMDEYFKLYKYAVQGVRRVNKEYKVGGPATAGAAWIPEMIKYCDDNSVPFDFATTHTYGVRHGFLDEFGTSGTILDKGKWAVSGDVLKCRKQIEESSKAGMELHFTEWSSSYTPSDPIHDSYHQPAYVLQKLKQIGDAATSMSYWVFTDIFEEAGPRFTPFHGGFGLLNYQGIKKPAYYAYNFMNKLGETELSNADSSSWACKTTEGDFQLLFWDFTNTHPGDSVLNQMYYIRDLPSKSKGKVFVKINNVPKGKYTLEIYKTGYKVNDPYSTYFSMGRPKQLTIKQIKTIKQENSGLPISTETVVVNSKHFKKEIDIRENDVFLLNFRKL
jgi:xylan 1,4-beta-xylosidase